MTRFLPAILIGSFILAAAGPAAAYTRRIEAETLRDAHDIGGGAIALVHCTTASNGFSVMGIDMPGEWLEFELLLVENQCLYTAVRSAGLPGTIRDFSVEIVPDPPAATTGADTLTTRPGAGVS